MKVDDKAPEDRNAEIETELAANNVLKTFAREEIDVKEDLLEDVVKEYPASELDIQNPSENKTADEDFVYSSNSDKVEEQFFECHKDDERFYKFHKFDAIIKTEEVDNRKEIGTIDHIFRMVKNLFAISLKALICLVLISVLLQPFKNDFNCHDAQKESNTVNVDETPIMDFKTKDVLDPYIHNPGLVKMEVKIKVTVNSIDAKYEVDVKIVIKNNIETTREIMHFKK